MTWQRRGGSSCGDVCPHPNPPRFVGEGRGPWSTAPSPAKRRRVGWGPHNPLHPLRPTRAVRPPLLLPRLRRRLRSHPGARSRPLLRAARARPGVARAAPGAPPTAGTSRATSPLRSDGAHELTLAVDGVQCGACVWLIESVLAREPDVLQGRVNMTTRRLKLVWRGAAGQADALVAHDRASRLPAGAVRRGVARRRRRTPPAAPCCARSRSPVSPPAT